MPDGTAAVRVLWCLLDGHTVRDLPELVDGAEPTTRRRLESLRFEADRAAALVAHGLARFSAGDPERSGRADPRAVRIVRTCTTCGSSEHGRPEAYAGRSRRGFLSIAHTRRIVVAGFSRTSEVGVDAEDAVLRDWSADLPQVFSAVERSWIERDPTGRTGRTYWVRKEALVKLHGVGIVVPLADVDVSAPESGARVDGPAPGLVRDVPIGHDGFAVAVATRNAAPLVTGEISIGDLRRAWAR